MVQVQAQAPLTDDSPERERVIDGYLERIRRTEARFTGVEALRSEPFSTQKRETPPKRGLISGG